MSWYYPKRKAKSTGNGIRLYKMAEKSKAGWGERWTAAVAGFIPKKQLERGLRYAKSGQVLTIRVDQGFASADVQGTRTRPYKVEIGLPMFTRKQWMRLADAILKKAFYTAKLLARDLPRDVEPLFRSAGAPLLPDSQDDFSSDCSCAELENPCKHVAAVSFILGQEIDRDPFLLMEMRGLTRAQLLAEIQARRAAGKNAVASPLPPLAAAQPPRTALSGHLRDFFDAPKDRPLARPAEPDFLARLPKPGGRLHEMGSPPSWQSDNDFVDVLTRIYQAVRRRALGG